MPKSLQISYPIFSGNSLPEDFNSWINSREYTQIVVLCDSNTEKFCYPVIKKKLPVHRLIVVKPGEQNKCLSNAEIIWKKMISKGCDRNSLIIALGGGMVCDLGGFTASVFMRGIDCIYIPTSLLAQVDASVGGKTGIDFGGFKNMVGTFKDPVAIFIAFDLLKTLPVRELKSGFAEVIKHALIAGGNTWKNLSTFKKLPSTWNEIITKSIEFKMKLVKRDPFEKNIRKVLNFGHTIGHAIESWSLFKNPRNPFLHGECVAAGMICELLISEKKFGFRKPEIPVSFIRTHIGKLSFSQKDIDSIVSFCSGDKKNKSGVIRAVLLKDIGKPEISVPLTKNEISASLNAYLSL